MILTYVFTNDFPGTHFPLIRATATKFEVDVDSPCDAIDQLDLIKIFAIMYQLSIHNVELDGVPFSTCECGANLH